MTDADRVARLRQLNDAFRQTFVGGMVVITVGVQALGPRAVTAILHQVRTFNAFTADNDPYGEHDFGAFDAGQERVLWKIDYYDASGIAGSEHPEDPEATTRVLTIMLAEEW
ncbi:DUF3768 domain-containing protein [Novispirillum sp. DQ9]|uniref:DUF3768 domain-containing protein n=1 Tax=Novispirillum sp. DQ9 TaxID=3398612 RepID=UPI003C7A04FC